MTDLAQGPQIASPATFDHGLGGPAKRHLDVAWMSFWCRLMSYGCRLMSYGCRGTEQAEGHRAGRGSQSRRWTLCARYAHAIRPKPPQSAPKRTKAHQSAPSDISDISDISRSPIPDARPACA